MESDPQKNDASNDRRKRVAQIIDDVRTAHAAGKEVDDQAIIAAHPDLAPDLELELGKLRRVQAAWMAAEAGGRAETATSPSDETARALAAELERPTIQATGYSILRELARGGQAVVYLAMQLSTGRKVALKVMRDGPLADDRANTRFQREVEALAALNHPNIVTIIDTGQTTDGSRYITMLYIAGWSLDEYMKQWHKKDPNDPSKLLRLFLRICAAVNVAHTRGIIHRDLKPSNIRIDDRGEPHILDFGLSRTAMDRFIRGSNSPLSITGEFLGSLPWSSPEQAEGDPDKIDARTDVYSLGVILYQILTGGKFPYEVVGNIRDVLNNILTAAPTPPSKVVALAARAQASLKEAPLPKRDVAMVNEGIEKIVLKALGKQPERRYQSAGELGRDISNYLSGQRAASQGTEVKSTRSRRIPPMAWRSLAGCVLVGLLAFGTWRLVSRRTPNIATGGSGNISATTPSQTAKKFAAISNQGKREIDLLKLVDPMKDTLSGIWTVNNNLLEGTNTEGEIHGAGEQIQFPYQVPEEYDYRVVFRRNQGAWGISLNCCSGGHRFSWVIGVDANKISAFEDVNGKSWRDPTNPTIARKEHLIRNGDWYTAIVKVRKGTVETYLDDELVCQMQVSGNELSDTKWHGDANTLGFFAFNPASVQSATLIEINGEGTVLRKDQKLASAQPISSQPQATIPAPATTVNVRPAPSGTSDHAVKPAETPQAVPLPVNQPKGLPADATAYIGHHYKLFKSELSWSAAAAECKAMGGYLASPEAAEDAAFLQQLKGSDTTAWIGGAADERGTWTWVDGNPIPKTLFDGSTQPNGYRWLFLTRNGKLSARPESGKIEGAPVPMVEGFICEWDQ